MMHILGLLSDTHYQDRLFALPARLAALFAGVDLLLHAGDVGDIDVLDQLSRLAPVVAVHGNDEPEYIQAWLPYQQIVAVHGLRVLLCHTHYPDRAEERRQRPGPWGPKLDRIAALGRAVGANLVVYGHTHVPLITRYDDMVLVNPGALASGNYFTRQAQPSVARLQVFEAGGFSVTHLSIDTGQPVEFPTANPDEEFSVLAQQYQTWMIEPDLLPDVAALGRLPYEDVRAVVRAVAPLCKRYIDNGLIPRAALVEVIHAGAGITANDRAQVLAVLERQNN